MRVVWKTVCPRVLFFAVKVVKEFALYECTFWQGCTLLGPQDRDLGTGSVHRLGSHWGVTVPEPGPAPWKGKEARISVSRDWILGEPATPMLLHFGPIRWKSQEFWREGSYSFHYLTVLRNKRLSEDRKILPSQSLLSFLSQILEKTSSERRPSEPCTRRVIPKACHWEGLQWTWMDSLMVHSWLARRRKWQPTPVFLPGGSQGQRSPVGCRLWGRTELDTTAAT